MIDTHLHILPGVDDGPETMEEALLLAQALVKEGIHTAIATPHYNDEFPHRTADEIRWRVSELQYALDRTGIPLRMCAGHEILINPGLLADILTGRCATLNGSRYLLLELYNSTWLPETERVIFELLAHGLIPVLAHPERYHALQQSPDRLGALLQQGVLTQLTASSLIGMQGNTARQSAETLLKKGLISCIASDSHGLKRRPPAIARGLERAAHFVGQHRVHQLTEIQPALILAAGSPASTSLSAERRF